VLRSRVPEGLRDAPPGRTLLLNARQVRQAGAEFVGTGLLVTVVVGSGIAAQRLSPSDMGLRFLENSLATTLGLTVLIWTLGPVSGAHFNPLITVSDRVLGSRRRAGEMVSYAVAQIAGAITGCLLAEAMFGASATVSGTDRLSPGTALAEVVATAGLVLVIFTLTRSGRPVLVAPAVGAYIGAAYWFTSSTAFANPAVTIGRIFTDTFAGIAPLSAFGFIGAQLLGAALGVALVLLLTPRKATP